MRVYTPALPYWAILGLGITTVTALAATILLRLARAFDAGHLTRGVLAEALVLALGMLVILVVAGWAFTARPRPPPAAPSDQWAFA